MTVWTRDSATLYTGSCMDVLPTLPERSVDLVFGSPPYEDARTYGIDFRLKGQDWVDWMVEVFRASLRVSRGLVAFVVEGRTRNFKWSATPVLLMADLHRAGIALRKPPAFKRVGIPGSGGPDWLRNDYEFIVCATNGGKLPWSDNTAMGHPPKWGPGGAMSNRLSSGARVNQWGDSIESGATVVDDGGVVRSKGKRPSHVERDAFGFTPHTQPSQTQRENGKKVRYVHTRRRRGDGGRGEDGMHNQDTAYSMPAIANPGNVIECNVGGGMMGSKLSHENEAPFPESLAEFFVRSFCPPGGRVCDPFSGSGTTVCVANRLGRNAIGIDLRQSQIELAIRRLEEPQAKAGKRPAKVKSTTPLFEVTA